MRGLLLAVLVLFPVGLLYWMWTRPPDARALMADSAEDAAASPRLDAAQTPVQANDPSHAAPTPGLRSAPRGFIFDGEVQSYNRDGLFEFIDGAAPQFIELGFVWLWAVDLKGTGGGEASLEIYDMARPDNAEAIFAKNRPSRARWMTLGDEAYRTRLGLVVRTDRYYVKLTAFDAGADDALVDAAGDLVSRLNARQTAAETKDDSLVVEAEPDRGRIDDDDLRLRAFFRPGLSSVKPGAEVQLYDATGLFEYINGAAPAYIDQGFVGLAAAELETPTGGELSCDIYDMGSTAHAQAMYETERPATAQNVEIGDRAHAGRLSLVLRKGRYYIKLTAFDAGAEAALPALAKELVGRMP